MCTIGGVVALDLRRHDSGYREDWQDVTRKIKDLAVAPAGADIVITVAARQFADFQGLDYLRRNGRHLGSVTFHCEDADTVANWVKAMRGGGL